jgi:hypothetical protein
MTATATRWTECWCSARSTCSTRFPRLETSAKRRCTMLGTGSRATAAIACWAAGLLGWLACVLPTWPTVRMRGEPGHAVRTGRYTFLLEMGVMTLVGVKLLQSGSRALNVTLPVLTLLALFSSVVFLIDLGLPFKGFVQVWHGRASWWSLLARRCVSQSVSQSVSQCVWAWLAACLPACLAADSQSRLPACRWTSPSSIGSGSRSLWCLLV